MIIRKEIESKLIALKLTGISAALHNQSESTEYESMGFLERLDDLLDNQLIDVANKRIATLKRQANLRWPGALVSDVNYVRQRSLKKAVITNLAELKWIESHQHLIITGPTGTGKTHLACAFANEAILNKISVGFYRYNELMLQLMAADKNGEIHKFHKKLNRIQLLVIDDWGISPLSAAQRHLIFELVESRDKASSMIITSQYPITAWYDAFQDPTIADSVLDRIVHSAHAIEMKGKSIREALGIKGDVK
jgi:DNA replication protein DnaC